MSRRGPVAVAAAAVVAGALACSSDDKAARGPSAQTGDATRPPAERPAEESQLSTSLKLEISGAEFSTADPIPAQVVLSNQGQRPVLVVSRLGVGYEDSLDRELYFTVTDAQGQPYTGHDAYRIDYNRPEVEDGDIQELAPGASVTTRVDLHEWYRLARPGTFTIRAVYQPEEHPRLDASTRAVSNPVTITIR